MYDKNCIETLQFTSADKKYRCVLTVLFIIGLFLTRLETFQFS